LREGAEIIQAEAKAEIGHIQAEAGPFPAWDPLAEATIEGWGGHPGKAELGHAPPDYDPLLRTGEMRDSIEVSADQTNAAVGSNSDKALWQEFGTPNAKHPIPPRSFLGRAAFLKGEEAAKAVGKAVTDALVGHPHSRSKPGSHKDAA
jgi:hypothetical protein